MKIRKVDDKPMVIHTKEKAKIHAHEPKGAKIKGSNIYTVERGPKTDGVDQIIIMFIIIAVAAGIAGLLYLFGKNTLLPNFQNKITNLINSWFDHA